MSVAGTSNDYWRVEHAETSRLAWAFGLSLAVHVLLFSGWYTDHRYHWTQYVHLPAWLKPVQDLVQLLHKKQPPPPPEQSSQEVPLMFVDVSSEQATAEAPKNAKFYSNKNSLAANPDANKETDVPSINGSQTEMVKTEDVPKEKFVPLQPSAPPKPSAPAQQQQQEQQEQVAHEAPQPKPLEKPGDLVMTKPQTEPQKQEQQQPAHQRPRLLAQVQPQARENRLPGEKMRQEGGVRRRLDIGALDAKGTPLGDYDRALVDAIAQCWYALLDAQDYALDYRGKVVLQFHLHSDGRVTDVNVTENSAGTMPGLLCQTAIDKPSPYAPFSPDLRRLVGETRSIQFTFYYNW